MKPQQKMSPLAPLLVPPFLGTFFVIALTFLLILLITATGHTGESRLSSGGNVSVVRVPTGESRGYGYKMQYIVPVDIEAFWRFKTDFDNEFLVTNQQLVGHRLVRTTGKTVITENRYATAPNLRFLWQTTVHSDQYRLEFMLLNAKDCRHDFHYGSIQLTPNGNVTVVTQTAFFNFTGAAVWVRYPWRGGMKKTLTKTAKWEQETASRYVRNFLTAPK